MLALLSADGISVKVIVPFAALLVEAVTAHVDLIVQVLAPAGFSLQVPQVASAVPLLLIRVEVMVALEVLLESTSIDSVG
jgi:hypothetical protein